MDDTNQTQPPTPPSPFMGNGRQDPQQTGQDQTQGQSSPAQPMATGQQYNSPTSPSPTQPQAPTTGQPSQQTGGGGLSGIMEKDIDISNLVQNAGQNQQQSQALFQMLPLQRGPGIKVDDRYFVELLAGSISLTYNEKVKIVQNFAKLSQYQVDELVKIFEEEKGKFAELEKKHAEQIKKFEENRGVNEEESAKDKAEEEERARKEAEEQARIMQQLQGNGGQAANDENYPDQNQQAA